jgi:hypothetical protein
VVPFGCFRAGKFTRPDHLFSTEWGDERWHKLGPLVSAQVIDHGKPRIEWSPMPI